MTGVSERVGATCPACSPELPTEHEVLSEGGQYTVRCVDCGHVHKTTIEDRTVERDVIVSQEGESFSTTVDIPPDEPLAVGDEFVAESEVGIFTVRITSLEIDGDRRVEETHAEHVEAVWTRDVGNVTVPVTVHPPEGGGDRDETESLELHVPGDYQFVVGETESMGEREFEVEGVHVRDAAEGYGFEKLDHAGDVAIAKDVKRLLARDQGPAGQRWQLW